MRTGSPGWFSALILLASTLAAQEPPRPAPQPQPDRVAAQQHLLKALEQPVTLQLKETPLDEAVDKLKNAAKVQIEFATKHLQDKRIATDTPVTHDFQNVPLKILLQQLLKPQGLAYKLVDEVILIDTPVRIAWGLANERGELPPGIPVPKPEELLREALEKRVSLQVIQTPLSEVVDLLREQVKVPFDFDKKALADVGIGTDTPVTRDLKDLPLRSLLRLVLKDLDLTYVVRDEMLVITTPEAVTDLYVKKVLPVRDLIEPDLVRDEDDPASRGDALIDVLVGSIPFHHGWDDDREGRMRVQGTSLALVLPPDDMEHVEQVIAGLRRSRELWKKWDGKTRVPALLGGVSIAAPKSPEVVRIEKALAAPAALEFIETPLSEVVDWLKEQHKIPIEFDRKAMADVGIGTDTPVTRNLRDVSLAAILRRMLKDLDLTFVIRDDVLLLTTPEEMGAKLSTRVYPVFDLVAESFGRRGTGENKAIGMGIGGGGVSPAPAPPPVPVVRMPPRRASVLENDPIGDDMALEDALSETIRPNEWDRVGGPSSLRLHPASRALVITTTDEVHAEIEDHFAKIRAQTPIPRKMSQEMLDEYDRQVISHVFFLAGDSPQRPMPDAKEVADAIRASVAPDAWKTPGNSLLAIRGRVRVVAPRKTVRAVDKLLRELDVLFQPPTPMPVRFPDRGPQTSDAGDPRKSNLGILTP